MQEGRAIKGTLDTAVYGLSDPTTGAVRYVGATQNPAKRLQRHLEESRTQASRSPKGRWILELKTKNLAPTLRVLEWVSDDEWEHAERAWIGFWRMHGDLLNVSDGGRTGWTPEQRRKSGETKRGRPMHPNTRAALAKVDRSNRSAEHRAKMSAANSGRATVRGAEVGTSRLTEKDVLEIRRRHLAGETGRSIAAIFGVTPANISAIVNRRSWRHVKGE